MTQRMVAWRYRLLLGVVASLLLQISSSEANPALALRNTGKTSLPALTGQHSLIQPSLRQQYQQKGEAIRPYYEDPLPEDNVVTQDPVAVTRDAPRRPLAVLQMSSFLLVLSSTLVLFAPSSALISRLGTDRATSTLSGLAASAALVEILLSPVIGSIIDSIGRKAVMLGAIGLLCSVNTLVVLKPSCLLCICAAKFVGSLSISQYVVATQAMTGDIAASDPKRLSAAMGRQMALLGAGFLVGSLIAGRLADLGLRVSYAASTLVGASAIMLISIAMSETLSESKRIPFQAHSARQLILQSPLSCTKLLLRHGRQVRILTILLILQCLPTFMGDIFQVFARTEWQLSTKDFSSFIALWGVIGIFANTVGSFAILRFGIKRFTGIATLSSALGPIGASFFGFRGTVAGSVVGFLGAAQSMGITAALLSQGEASGVPRGELAGERASMVALLKVIGPILYSTLYVMGRGTLGIKQLPFVFNIFLAIGACIVSQLYLPSQEQEP